MSSRASQCVALTEQEDSASQDLREILEGLSRPQKALSPKFFYDERGSELFDAITRLPEYYLTDAELEIMESCIDDIGAHIGRHASLIEFGSGASLKIRILLEHLLEPAAYVPVDISRDYLLAAAEELARDFPHIEVLPVAADFTQPIELPEPKIPPWRNVVYFPGSTIGNFSPEDALELLKVMRLEAGEGGALLIGADLQKDRETLERAYNDSAGVTAAFNLNILQHLNNAFSANFDLSSFRHEAVYNERFGRIEMYLVSLTDQCFSVDGVPFKIREGERILTEHSHKYTLESFRALAARAGLEVTSVWMDSRRLFSVQYCEPA